MNTKTLSPEKINWPNTDTTTLRLLKQLVSENGMERTYARNTISEQGSTILPILHKLVKNNNERLQWEVAKMLQDMAYSESIPELILLLDHPDSEIRWIAAEGLIRIGKKSISPLLKAIINRKNKNDSIFRKGVHHVFIELFDDQEKKDYKNLMESLDGRFKLGETAPLEAQKALDNLNTK